MTPWAWGVTRRSLAEHVAWAPHMIPWALGVTAGSLAAHPLGWAAVAWALHMTPQEYCQA